MKKDELYEDLLEVAEKMGITVRKGNGNFKSAYCVLNDKKTIIFNKNAPLETKSLVLARCLNNNEIGNIFIKPVIREFLEKEKANLKNSSEFNLEVDYDEEEWEGN